MSFAFLKSQGAGRGGFAAALAVSACLAALAPSPASAGDAGAVAAGIVGGAALGALAVGAFNPAPPPPVRVYRAPPEPVYYESAPRRIYVEPPPPRRVYVEPSCMWEMQRVWTGYRWVRERVRVCD